MQIDVERALIQMSERQPLKLTDAAGIRLRAVAGTSWVTIDDDPRDLILEPGDELEIATGRPVLATSLHGCATLAVSAGRRAVARGGTAALQWLARRGADGLARLAGRLGTPPRPRPAG